MQKLGDILGTYLVEKNRNNDRDFSKFHPSSIGYCTRKIVYTMSGYPSPDPDARALAIFENGHSFHNRTEYLFGKAGILIAPELPIKDEELNISGRTDAVVRNPNKELYTDTSEITLVDFDGNVVFQGPNNEVVLVELKSINNRGFNRVKNEGAEGKHAAQLQLYMFLTKIKQGIVFYENKDTQETVEFWLDYNPRLVDQLIEKIKTVNSHVNNKTLPEREGTRNSYTCNYCEYKDVCWCDLVIIPSLDEFI